MGVQLIRRIAQDVRSRGALAAATGLMTIAAYSAILGLLVLLQCGAVLPRRAPSATLLAEWPLDAGVSNCQTGANCFRTGTALTCTGGGTLFGTFTCNRTAPTYPVNKGTYSGECTAGLCIWPAYNQVEAGHTEVYAIVEFHLSTTAPTANIAVFQGTTGAAPLTNSYFVGRATGSTTSAYLILTGAGGSPHTEANCYTANAWNTIKIRMNTDDGEMDLWCDGADFTGSPTVSLTGASSTSEDITGWQWGAISDGQRVYDSTRIFDSDPS